MTIPTALPGTKVAAAAPTSRRIPMWAFFVAIPGVLFVLVGAPGGHRRP